MTIELLPQAWAVKNLLNSIQVLLPQIPDSQDKETLIEAIEVFQNTTTLTTWDVEDVKKHVDLQLAEQVSDDEAKQVLIQMFNDYECHEEDWYRITQAYDSVKRDNIG